MGPANRGDGATVTSLDVIDGTSGDNVVGILEVIPMWDLGNSSEIDS